MFKKRSQKGSVRRAREVDDDDRASKAPKQDESSTSAVIRDEVQNKKKANAFSTSTGADKTALRQLLAEKSEGADKHVYGGDATAYNEVDTAEDRDARAIAERNLSLQEEEAVGEDGTKIYRGQAGYKNYIKKDAASLGNNKNTGTQGPIRAPAFFRATCRFDYQPDICKDYRDTGFCGFGDSCKFMHDRGNYKSGWQMEKEWEEKETKRKAMIAMGLDPDKKPEDDDEDGGEFAVGGGGGGGTSDHNRSGGGELPYACHLCRGPFVEPVRTKCGHYFCSTCVAAHYKKGDAKCPICGVNTAGIFNFCRRFASHAAKAGGCIKLFTDARAMAASVKADEKAKARLDNNGNVNGDAESEDEAEKDERETAELVTAAEARTKGKASSGSGGGGGGGGSSSGGGGGGWAVVEEEEAPAAADGEEGGGDGGAEGGGGGGSGVSAILEAEAEVRAKAEAEVAEKAVAEAAAEAERAKLIRAGEAAVAAQASSAAILGWVQVTNYGQTYWFHQAKNQTARELPAEVAEHAAAATATGEAAAPVTASGTPAVTTTATGWQALKDDQGRTYYFNPSSRETSWFPR